MKRNKVAWLLLAPLALLGLGVGVTERGENEVEAALNRAQETWLRQDYEAALDEYKSVYREYPKSRHAPTALWETASIYYSHHYDLDRTIQYLEKLIKEYPGSLQAKDALLRLAEIYETEDRDLKRATEYWEQALQREGSFKERRQAQLKLGDAYLKQHRLTEAEKHLLEAVAEAADDHLGQQAHIRLGTIAQIKSEHQVAIDFFEAAMAWEECQECRNQARLGLFESHQFLGDIPAAISVAEAIPKEQRPELAELLSRAQ